MRPGNTVISARISEGRAWWTQGLPNQAACSPSAHVPVYLWPEDLQGLMVNREDSRALFFVRKGFLISQVGLAFSLDDALS